MNENQKCQLQERYTVGDYGTYSEGSLCSKRRRDGRKKGGEKESGERDDDD